MALLANKSEGIPPISKVFAPLGLNSVRSVPNVEQSVKWEGGWLPEDRVALGRKIGQCVLDSGYIKGNSPTGAIINARETYLQLKEDDQVFFVIFDDCPLALITTTSRAMTEANAAAKKKHSISFTIIAVVSTQVLKENILVKAPRV